MHSGDYDALLFVICALFCLFLLCPRRGAQYCNQLVCLSVCPRAYLWDRWTDLHEFFVQIPVDVARPPLAALRYVMYFRFYG